MAHSKVLYSLIASLIEHPTIGIVSLHVVFLSVPGVPGPIYGFACLKLTN